MTLANKIFFMGLALALSAGLGWYSYNSKFSSANIHTLLKHATYLYDQGVAISEYELIDHNNQAFTIDNIRGQWTFWFFGFTHCPDICPITLGTLSATVNSLVSSHKINAEEISIIFVSVDPERDKTENLKAYVNAFSKNAIGVTNTEEKLAPFLKNMGIIASKQKTTTSESDYLVDHSSSVYLIAPNTAISAVFGTPHKVENIAQDFLTIKKYYK